MPFEDVLPLSPRSFYILLVLAEGEAHGYAIAQAVAAATGGSVQITPGTLYPIVRQMLADGWIAETTGTNDDPRRRTYRLSPRGRRIAQAEAARLEQAIRMAHRCKLLPASTPA
ncbi:MAG TPA: PadR family transcriptional regulator [Candidatus Baltobacteraceae bacterium]